ncbi:SH3 domain-containing protein [Anaerocolumna xylanovorans]|uniref:SH3 domain-containing protein n=1 Tax=Anaerocolumna xylanovorans DSM 12503 TaxID=1121345 RepID=A0A1M7Y636_9FIRM|nr:SH3 domain-containing protein [Anaerocolumna xylanovorans]SHO48113.1 hypothetical protein SAMN02745217_01682 [Anaerocolumna xylanovorans DSM 12503]
MKLKVSNYVKGILFLGILTMGLLLATGSSFAAQKSSGLDGVKILDKDTTYQYDLNGDGKADTIQYKTTENDEKHTATIKLYINKKLCLTKTDDGLFFRVFILDLYKNDNHLDLFIHTGMESDGVKNAFFVQYDGTKIVNKIKFDIDKLTKNFGTYRYSIEETDGKGKFTTAIDTPIYSKATGCYYCYVSFILKDNKISIVPASTYTLTKFSREYTYKAVKGFSVYEKAGSKKAVYQVKKGDKVTFDRMYVSKTGKAYFRIINSKGKKGWINSDQENLFAELPLWG